MQFARRTAPRRVARAAVLMGTVAAALGAPGVASAVDVCPGMPAPTVVGTSTNTSLTNKFTTYGNSGAGWTGGDSTYSTRLPNGNDLWQFSDTFMEPITPPTRPASALMIHNSFVKQAGSTLTTITGGTASAPDSLVNPPTAGHWYWAGAGTVNGAGTYVEQPIHEWQKTGPSIWDIAWVANKLARYPVGNLSSATVTSLPSATGIQWASWVAHEGSYTYVYGVEDLGADKYMHIARVTGTSLTGTWKYYKGGDPALAASWSSTESDSIRVLDHVSNEYSVHKVKTGLYMLTTFDTTVAFDNHVVAYFSCSPTGPFVAQTALYTAPETGPLGSYADGDVYAYNAHVHPQLSTSTNIVFTYNVNSLDPTVGVPGDLYRDVSIYRPRFINLQLTP